MSQQRTSAVTLMDVAREAGVSLATASRAINGSNRQVGDDLRERVLEAARKLNYAANSQAQAVAKGQTNIVGLLVHDIADPYFSSIAAGVMHAASSHHMLVTLAHTERSAERELEHLSALRGQHSRVVIMAGSRIDDDAALKNLRAEIEAFERTGGRVVMISQPIFPVDTVELENRAGARELARELVDLGYRRFAVLTGPPALLTARERTEGFTDGLAAAGIELDPANIIHAEFTRDGGYQAMTRLLDRHPEILASSAGTSGPAIREVPPRSSESAPSTFTPAASTPTGSASSAPASSGRPTTNDTIDCIFAANDVMAVGAMTACRDRGIQLPDDLALAGFDDISTLRDVSPALTTVQLPLERAGRLALELALDASPGEPPRHRAIAGEVVLRQSTPPR